MCGRRPVPIPKVRPDAWDDWGGSMPGRFPLGLDYHAVPQDREPDLPLPNHDECRTCGNTRSYDELISGGGTCRSCKAQEGPTVWRADDAIQAVKETVDRRIDRILARPPIKVIMGPPRTSPFGETSHAPQAHEALQSA